MVVVAAFLVPACLALDTWLIPYQAGAMRPPVLYIDPVTEESGEHASWEGLRPALLLPGILLYPGTASQDHSQV